MNALIYLLKTTMVNYFKRLKEKPLKIVGPVFMVLWVLLMFVPDRSRGGNHVPVDVFVSGFVFFTMIMFLFALYSGTKRVDSKFGMADVNFIFVSPIRPQTVMLYGIVKKIALELLASGYILYQVPHILRTFNAPGINQGMLIVSFIIFQLVLCNVAKLFIFSLSTRIKGLGEAIRDTIKVLILLSVAGVIYLIISGNIIGFFMYLFNKITYSPWIEYIPIFGWMKGIALQTITGINASYGIYMLLILLLSGLLLYITYTMELDFYEDMLSSAERNDLIKNPKNGMQYPNEGGKRFLLKPFREIEMRLNGIYGARVLFFKHMNEYFKRSLIFFINTYSLILLLVSIASGLFFAGIGIKVLFFGASAMMLFTVGFGGKIYGEIAHYFIFLLPDTPQRKLFYGISSSLVKIFTDGIILFIPFGILSRTSIFEILLCIICYLALGGMLSYSGLFAFRIADVLGFTGAVAQGVFFVFFQLFLMIIGVIIISITTLSFTSLKGYAVYMAILTYSIFAAAIFSLGCVGILEDMHQW